MLCCMGLDDRRLGIRTVSRFSLVCPHDGIGVSQLNFTFLLRLHLSGLLISSIMVDIIGRMRATPIAIFLLSHLLSFGSAQSSTSGGGSTASGTATSSSAATTWTVSVGEGSNVFKPNVVQANIGDIIEFDFYPANHSVCRAEYLYPCIPYEDTGKGKVGFFSGFHPVDAILSNPPTWSIRVNDSNPIFYYCTAPDACIEDQMVGVINPVRFIDCSLPIPVLTESECQCLPSGANGRRQRLKIHAPTWRGFPR